MIMPTDAALERYLRGQRWFAGKGRDFRVRGALPVQLPGPESGPSVVILLVRVGYDDGSHETWHVPLSYRRRAVAGMPGYLGRHEGLHVYDAAQDRGALEQVLDAFRAGTENESFAGTLRFRLMPGVALDGDTRPAPMEVDQSNSSIAFGEQALLKLFRKVAPGVHPDVEITEALTRAGSRHVPALFGSMVLETPEGPVQLGMLQQFLRTASDGWTLARGSMRGLLAEADLHPHEVGGDFATEAARLGEAVAAIHTTLAGSFPQEVLDAEGARTLAARLLGRLDGAVADVPALAPYADDARPVLAAVGELDAIPVHRIHGDLHLGQTLRTVRGWKVVDFEGEPARPLAERREPDSAWRDVAGMLRSFDYVSGVVQREVGASSDSQLAYRGAEWVERNREAFVTAYSPAGLTPAERTLCDAFELDKAVYECVYEARSRPDWVDIPLAAVARLVARSPEPGGK